MGEARNLDWAVQVTQGKGGVTIVGGHALTLMSGVIGLKILVDTARKAARPIRCAVNCVRCAVRPLRSEISLIRGAAYVNRGR